MTGEFSTIFLLLVLKSLINLSGSIEKHNCGNVYTQLSAYFLDGDFRVCLVQLETSYLQSFSKVDSENLRLTSKKSYKVVYNSTITGLPEKKASQLVKLNIKIEEDLKDLGKCNQIACYIYYFDVDHKVNKQEWDKFLALFNMTRTYKCEIFNEVKINQTFKLKSLWLAVNFFHGTTKTNQMENSHAVLTLNMNDLGIIAVDGCIKNDKLKCLSNHVEYSCFFNSIKLGITNTRKRFFMDSASACIRAVSPITKMNNGTIDDMKYIEFAHRFEYCNLIAKSFFIKSVRPWPKGLKPSLIATHGQLNKILMKVLEDDCEVERSRNTESDNDNCKLLADPIISIERLKDFAQTFCDKEHKSLLEESFLCMDFVFLYQLLTTGLELTDLKNNLVLASDRDISHMEVTIGLALDNAIRKINCSNQIVPNFSIAIFTILSCFSKILY